RVASSAVSGSGLSVVGGHFAAGDRGHRGQQVDVDGHRNPSNRAVAHQEVHPVGVEAAEAALARVGATLTGRGDALDVVVVEDAALRRDRTLVVRGVGVGPERGAPGRLSARVIKTGRYNTRSGAPLAH